MDKDKRKEVIDALMDFIIRVTKGNATSEETYILPEVAKILLTD